MKINLLIFEKDGRIYILFKNFVKKAGFQSIFVNWQGKNIFVRKEENFRQKAAPPFGGLFTPLSWAKWFVVWLVFNDEPIFLILSNLI